MVQKHDASSLHYDFRLEFGGVLVSWALPKGLSTDPRDRRLAIRTEDHPRDYIDFEGVIPEGEYGAGAVLVWDIGSYQNLRARTGRNSRSMEHSLEDGLIEVWLEGEKLHGGYALKRIAQDAEPRWKTSSIAEWREQLSDDERQAISRKAMPGWTEPMLAALSDVHFSSPEWIYERKLGGECCLAFRRGSQVRPLSRNRGYLADTYPELVEALTERLPEHSIVDGEIVTFEGKVVTSFSRLQQRIGITDTRAARDSRVKVHPYLFDLLRLYASAPACEVGRLEALWRTRKGG